MFFSLLSGVEAFIHVGIYSFCTFFSQSAQWLCDHLCTGNEFHKGDREGAKVQKKCE